ncbi:MAG: hypothetical protein MZV70_04630 [Desulfobacterales bacterium]|nr:hypothetical protein [Desulfobacterales bacterium]
MKKLTMIFVTVLMVAGLSASALADPGWSNGKRYGNRDRYEHPQYQYDHRDYRDHRVAYRNALLYTGCLYDRLNRLCMLFDRMCRSSPFYFRT